MRELTCCFSGHRIIPKIKQNQIQFALEKAIEKSINDGYLYFGAGGALGFDTMAATTVLKLKVKHPEIKLILVIPCKNQTKNWSAKEIDKYNDILNQADKVVFTSENYYDGCMQKRNRHLIDNSSRCICYLAKDFGGTAYTVKYANEQNVEVINVNVKN